MRFWMVVCSRGHCGIRRETEIKYAIAAESLVKAMDIARMMPSVKHHRMPSYGREITAEEYIEYRQISAYQRYEQHKSTHYEKKHHR